MIFKVKRTPFIAVLLFMLLVGNMTVFAESLTVSLTGDLVSWNAILGATTYKIEEYNTTTSTYETKQTNGTLSYDVSTYQSGTYKFKVTAYDEGTAIIATSAETDITITRTTTPAPTDPQTPTTEPISNEYKPIFYINTNDSFDSSLFGEHTEKILLTVVCTGFGLLIFGSVPRRSRR